MTSSQKYRVEAELKCHGVIEELHAHHGNCIGSDAEFHAIVRREDPMARIFVHWPVNTYRCAFLHGDVDLPPKDFGVRDDDIIAAANLMLATPYECHEILRGSGTWMTIRHAIKAGKPIYIYYPDGETQFIEGQPGGAGKLW